MTLTDIEAVRLNTSDKAKLKREEWIADGATNEVQLALSPVQLLPILRAWKNDVLLVDVIDYTLDTDNGIVRISLPPTVNDVFVFEYYATVFTDEEVDYFLTTASGSIFLASAYLLLAMAVEVSRIARRETLAGGGVFGQATIDTSVRARELRAQAASFIDIYNKTEGTDIPAEGLTQVVWTDAMGVRWTADALYALIP